MKAGIKGIGVVGGFGCGIARLEQALDTGRTQAEKITIETVKGTVETSGLMADTSRLKDFVNLRKLRRTDHYTQMALLACLLALEDAGLRQAQPPVEAELTENSLGIIMGTGYGSTCNTFDFQDLTLDNNICGFSPIQFSNSVHNAAAAHISAFLNEKGPNLSINQFDMSVCSAFMTGLNWLAEERVEHVLVGVCDDFSRIMACHGYFLSLENKAENKPENNLSFPPVGEGSAFFLLGKDDGSNYPYGFIKDAGTGVFDNPVDNAPVDNISYILNSDKLVNNCLPEIEHKLESDFENIKTASFIHIYGSMPVNMGFDIAIAGLSIKTGKVWGALCPGESGKREICCLKAGASGESGMVTVSES